MGALIHQPPSAYILLRTANFLPRIISRGREKRSREENSAQDFVTARRAKRRKKKERDERIFSRRHALSSLENMQTESIESRIERLLMGS